MGLVQIEKGELKKSGPVNFFISDTATLCLTTQSTTSTIFPVVQLARHNIGELYVNWRGLGYWRVVCKSEGLTIS